MEQEWGEATFLTMASRAQPGPAVIVEEERSCIPSRCQAAQTLLSSNCTWLEPFREGQGRRRRGWGKKGEKEKAARELC